MNSLQSCISGKVLAGQRIAVMGVGSVLRSDDAAGMYCIEQLQSEIGRDNLLLIAASTAPENFTGVIKDFAPDVLFIVDAAHMGLPQGELRVLDADEIRGMSFSTHMLPLSVMLEYLALEMRCQVICIGIQPGSTEQGFSMCEEVRAGVEQLAGLFLQALHNC